MNENGHIFLSYRSTEVDFALKLAADLKNEGVRLWMDRLDIKPGSDWLSALQEALNDAAAVIAVISPEYVNAEYCRRELARADRLKRPIFPVLLEPITPSAWPIEIERQQYIDFKQWVDHRYYTPALQQLVAVLREKFMAQFSTAPDPETRYLTNLIARLEANRRVTEYIEQITEADQLLISDFTRPQPGSIKQKVEQLTFALVTRPHGYSPADGTRPPSQRMIPLDHFSDVLDRHNAVVLAGTAGSGKTIALHNFILEVAHQRQVTPVAAPLPLLVRLSEWQGHQNLLDFIRSRWPLDTDAIKLIARGEIIVCMDGLNELPDPTGEKVRALRDWLNGDMTPRAVVTCRVEDYPARDLGLPLVVVQEMDRARIQQFVMHYLGEVNGDIFISRVLSEDENMRHMYHLCRNPFLLSALILVFKSNRHGDLPNNLGQLLKRLVIEMWKRARPAQETRHVTFDQLELALTDLAYSMIDDGMPVYISLESALDTLGTPDTLDAAVAAHFLERQDDQVRFTYQVIQEYFAALGLARAGLDTHLAPARLDASGQRIPSVWDRIIAIVCGMLPNPDANIWSVAQHDPFLALECIAGGITVQETTLLQIIPLLTNRAHTEGKDSRVATARILARIDHNAALPILMEALRDESWTVCWAAIQALWEIDTPIMPGLAETLHELEDEIRDPTAVALRQLGDAAMPTLLKLLRDNNWSVRRGAAWALGETRDEAALPALVDALYDDDHLVSAEAAVALGQIRSASAIPWLKEAIRHENTRVRRAAAKSLGWIGIAALNDILTILRDTSESDDMRRLMVEALTYMNNSAAYDAVLETTYDHSVEVRCAAVEALERTGDPRTVKRLIECLSDTAQSRLSNFRVCDVAARLLQAIGTGEALFALERWRQQNQPPHDPSTPPTRPPQPGTKVKTPSGRSADTLIQRLNEMDGNGKKKSSNGSGLHAPDWTTRRDTARNLQGAPAETAVPLLIDALTDEDNQVRIAVVETLATFDAPDALAALITALNDTDYLVCDAVSTSLKRIGKPAVPGLIDMLQSSNPNARGAAVETLGAIGDPAAVQGLITCLFDDAYPWMSEEPISEIAARALLAIDTPEARDAVRAWRRANPTAETTEPVEGPFEPDITEHGPGEKPAHRSILLRLIEDLHSGNWQTRQNAAKAMREYARMLRGSDDLELVQRLTTALSDPDWVVRWAAVEALAWVRAQIAGPALVEIIHDPNWTVRVAVVRALGEMGYRNAVTDIADLLDDSKSVVREAAAEALGQLSDIRAVPALQRTIEDPEPFVRLASVEALGRIRGAGIAQPLALALRDDDNHVRWAAARVLREAADESVITELIACLNDTDHPYWERQRVCDLAASALEHIGSPEALAAVSRWRAQRAS